MNAIELIERVREHDAELAVENERLVIRGKQLPEDLEAELREHAVELMIALGLPIIRTAVSVMEDVRPQLPKSLAGLPDDKLLQLVKWAMITSWDGGMRKLEMEQQAKAQGSKR